MANKMKKSHFGLIGLAVMGQNLARNIARNYQISVYNRTTAVTEDFINEFGSEQLIAQMSLQEFVNSLEVPRKVGVMVQAGNAVDAVIKSLLPLLAEGDTIIDFGNSNYQDSIRRENELSNQNIHFFGCGVSGGEEGALNGPSLMPGGKKEVFDSLSPIFKSIAADDFSGNACVSYIGENGAGHFVKMVHNGIEYGVMQMMAEAYEILSRGYQLNAGEIANIFEKYHNGKLHSYLFEISLPILRKIDPQTNDFLLDNILDAAGQKGTGRWTAIESLQLGSNLSVITEAVYARINSSEKLQRQKLAKIYQKPEANFQIPLEEFVAKLENTLFAGMLVSYAQGFALFEKAEIEHNWQLDFAEISRIWQGGCIIRADILKILEQAFSSTTTRNLLEIPGIIAPLTSSLSDFRETVASATANGIPVFSLAGALSGFEAMTNENTSANFIQGLRDYFGAHTFLRKDKTGIFHADWSENGEIVKIKD